MNTKNQVLKFINETEDLNFLVQIIELAFYKSGAKTFTNFAESNGISYNGVKKFRKHIVLDGKKFAVDLKCNNSLPF